MFPLDCANPPKKDVPRAAARKATPIGIPGAPNAKDAMAPEGNIGKLDLISFSPILLLFLQDSSFHDAIVTKG